MAGLPKSKRSGGPRTSKGKISAAKNSLKTGAYSSLVVLPNESEEDFLKLQGQFIESLSPVGVAETALVHDLTVITWKKLRLEKLEQSAFVRLLNKKVSYYELGLSLGLNEDFDWLINQINLVDEALISESKTHIDYIKSLSEYGISKDQFYDLPERLPSLFEFIKILALQHFETDDRDPRPESMGNLYIYEESGNKIVFLDYAMEMALKRARQVIYVSEHLSEIKTAVRLLKEKRLLEQMQVAGLARANDDLSRAYFKTLSELRKQQQWRLKMSVIDVAPSEQS